MRITQVECRRLVSLDNYSNVSIGAVADVGSDESPERALQQLEAFVVAQLTARGANAPDLGDLEMKRLQLTRDIEAEERKLAGAQRRWQEARAFLVQHGLNPDTYLDPFQPVRATDAEAFSDPFGDEGL